MRFGGYDQPRSIKRIVCLVVCAACSFVNLAATTTPVMVSDSMNEGILSPSAFKPYVDRFNREDVPSESLAISNQASWSFLERNIPLFDCPDKQLEETYYFRWWTYRKHLTQTPAGWVVTEFLPPVPWASIYNTISCAAGHHLYEGRWLWDRRYADDYARFWMLPEAQPRHYSFWCADAVLAVTRATGDFRLARDLLPNLVANYRAWERSHRDSNGLFRQDDGNDGMEFSLGGSGYRPSINSYMYGDATAIAEMATRCGEHDLAVEFGGKAAELKYLVQAHLWNTQDGFFETAAVPASSTPIETRGVREEIGFTPWYFNLPDAGFVSAWKQLFDPQGFAAPFGPTTVERRARGFMHPEDHDCLWNGPSWPYATTQTLVAMANVLDGAVQSVVTKHSYFELLTGYARSQQKNGRPWIAEDLDADSGNWIVDLPRSISYNHSGFADLVISGLVGLRPRYDDTIVVKPLVPAGTWKWFCLDHVPYHGQSIAVVWDSDGSHYHLGSGLSLFMNGRRIAHRPDLGDMNAALSARTATAKLPSRWEKHTGGPVLGGSLGTCFDVCMLKDKGVYKMYFSWRPKKSVAVTESKDGVHWGEPRILIGPSSTGWEDDINRPSVVKRAGVYQIWYTGQFDGRSSIGFATSTDGVQWERREKPVMEPDRPWEKVAVMCPSVLWDESAHLYRMWYSGGEQYEPDAIGYAVSSDGVHWKKEANPIFEADPSSRWEQYKVTACQVLRHQGWYVMFYIGFRDIDHAQIGIARSRDGISHWERLKDNPIVSPTVEGWDADACYKPFAIFDKSSNRWMLWYNGRHGGLEQIGLAVKRGTGLGF
ncbi:MAG: family 43 glycosylhydrolase [Fimbriimonas sp.]|nr:family 43 glycosylhydrolase [Fimbriimonas sp.]